MDTGQIETSYNSVAGIGLVLIVPPLLFVSASIIEYGLGLGHPLSGTVDRVFSTPESFRVFDIVSAAVFLGGLTAAALANLHAITGLSAQWRQTALVATVTVRANLWNLGVVVLSGALLSVLITYAFLEYFTTRPH